MTIKKIGFVVVALIFAFGCGVSQSATNNSTKQANTPLANTTPITTKDIVGTWDVQLKTRRGNKSSVLTIFEESGKLKGKTERTNFDIERNNNQLTWNSKVDSPLGAIDAAHQVLIEGKAMSGTVKAKGRTIELTGSKR